MAEAYLMREVIPDFETYDPYNAKAYMSIGASQKARYYPCHDVEALARMFYLLISEVLPTVNNAPVDPTQLNQMRNVTNISTVSVFVHHTIAICF